MHPFIHLRAHSQYSILDASASISDLVNKAAQNGMPALALTDHGNLFGVVDFYKECKEAKIKSILGCELYVAPQSRLEKNRIYGFRAGYSLPLLAKNNQGYHHLCKLSSIGYLEGFYYFPRIDRELLQIYHNDLICLDGSLGTRLAHEILQGTKESIEEHIEWYLSLFGEDYYFDIQRHSMSSSDIQSDGYHQETWLLQQYQEMIQRQQKVNEALIELSLRYSIPLVATNDIHYLEREDWRAHEILLNVQSGEPTEIWEKDSDGNLKFRTPNPKRQTYPSHEYYFKSNSQMEELFKDIPEALSNTFLVAEKCDTYLDFKTKHYPVYTPPDFNPEKKTKEERAEAVEKFLWKLCREGIPLRYTPERLAKIKDVIPDRDPLEVVHERLEYEMNVIVPKEMSDYLLIVWDFINWAKSNQIPVGPGRGSGAGSIVLYLIGVTDIEPLRFHLFFERFINPERISYPDIDVDICMDRRGEVINYTLQKYGKENIAQIITFGTMKAKMALKDVGRVLNVPLARVNELAKLIPEDLNITLDKALEKDQDLKLIYETDHEAARLINLARRLEGSIRNTGIHAAGIIISGSPLTDLIPICHAKDSEIPVTQFSMKPVEAVGMLKVDFLGLKTLTACQVCVDAIFERTGNKIDWINLPLEDKPTFDLLNQGKTLGIFQLESEGMQDLARHLHLDRFEEIIAVGALYRPGPMDMIPSFINRKHGREPIENDHPWMKDILAETYGIMVYQEQVMQIASKLANFSLGEGDVLRRAMGKKDLEQMAQQREKFRLGALQNQIDEQTSMLIFDKMEKFASYGFNKSHAAAYGYLSYVTAYLKANYPREWMAALMTCDRDDLTKVAKFIRECQSMGIAMLPPDINEAGGSFQATQEGIRFAMSGIKGVGAGVVEAIIKERKKNGPFTSFYQFFKRIDLKKVGKKIIENLVEAGCFDFTKWTRDALLMSVDPLYETVSKEQKEYAAGILSLFSLLGDETEKRFSKPPQVRNPKTRLNTLLREKELLGFFLTGHPMDDYKPVLQRLSCVPLRRLDEMSHDALFRSSFIVESVQVKIASKSQKKFAILIISDGIERQELPIWFDLYEEKSHLLNENQMLYAVLQVDRKEDQIKLSCKWLDDLTKANDEMIEACDRAYDKAKQYTGRMNHIKSSRPTKTSSENEKKPVTSTQKEPITMKPISIKMNANKTRLSHIVRLKEILSSHGGSTPLEISFDHQTSALAVLHIEAKKGVTPSVKLKQELCEVESVLDVDFQGQ
ncbi:MAG: DNA polymerase III subunit alpha [Parachlamydiaceae bacterium]|nr:DNA polymerase III subunit alpha [Parachlamydiaceae bacterium]